VKIFLIISLNLGKSFFANKTKELLLNARCVYFDRLDKHSSASASSASAALPGLRFIFYDFIITISPEFSYPPNLRCLKGLYHSESPRGFSKAKIPGVELETKKRRFSPLPLILEGQKPA
jgi:hypothetical protein